MMTFGVARIGNGRVLHPAHSGNFGIVIECGCPNTRNGFGAAGGQFIAGVRPTCERGRRMEDYGQWSVEAAAARSIPVGPFEVLALVECGTPDPTPSLPAENMLVSHGPWSGAAPFVSDFSDDPWLYRNGGPVCFDGYDLPSEVYFAATVAAESEFAADLLPCADCSPKYDRAEIQYLYDEIVDGWLVDVGMSGAIVLPCPDQQWGPYAPAWIDRRATYDGSGGRRWSLPDEVVAASASDVVLRDLARRNRRWQIARVQDRWFGSDLFQVVFLGEPLTGLGFYRDMRLAARKLVRSLSAQRSLRASRVGGAS